MSGQGFDLVPVVLPPHGRPLGSNVTWKIGAHLLIPLLKIISKPTWIGGENIPETGPMIAFGNHISYADPLFFAYFLYEHNRAVRFMGKASLFRIPVMGWILRSAGQLPVEREVKGSTIDAVHQSKALLAAGHCLGIYPEGTLTRDEKFWPMVAKTGLARLAVTTKAPVIPCAQWGAASILAPYSKRIKLWPRTKVVMVAGKPLDFSPWFGKEEDHEAMVEASAYAMLAITQLLETIRGESAPKDIFDPHRSELPRVGNFKKTKNMRDK